MDEKYRQLEDLFSEKGAVPLGLDRIDVSVDDSSEDPHLYPILEDLENATGHYSQATYVCAGGEKRIFKVRDHRTDRMVALAKPLEGASKEQKEQFLREGRLTACLQHPNIMSVYDQGIDEEGNPFFTMEFVHGDTLREIIKQLREGNAEYERKFPPARLFELFVKICDAVAYAHSRNVLHLDLKPSNITIGPFGEALLCDWGLAKVMQDSEPVMEGEGIPAEELPDGDILNDLSERGMVKGTPGFMAPEQVKSNGQVSKQTDIYSLGALLYFILTCKPPIKGMSWNDVAANTFEISGTNWLEYSYRRRTDAAARGLDYSLELNTNLVSGVWSTNGYAETGTAPLETGFEAVTNQVPTTEMNRFIRLRISVD